MKIGIVGYQGCGKSTLFQWISGVEADPALSHTSQSATATAPERRFDDLCKVYHPKKMTYAALEIIDTPGLSRTHEGSAKKLAAIREAGCLVMVVAAFGESNPNADLRNFEDDLLIADLEIVGGRVERLRESVKKPKPNRKEQEQELEALLPLLALLEDGKPLHEAELSPEQKKATRSFQLFSEKPRLVIFNIADDDQQPERFAEKLPPGIDSVSVSLGLQLELSQMQEEERNEFCSEMGVESFDRDQLLQQMMTVSGQMLFFTAGEKEVRTWLIRRGGTALEAADGIHSDLARGFIRAETMNCDDLIRLGSEREIKAQSLMRQEPKDYVIQDGDIINIRFSV